MCRVSADNAQKFCVSKKALRKIGIELHISSLDTTKSDGLLDRASRILLDKPIVLFNLANIKKSWWNDTVLHVNVLLNATIKDSLEG